MTFLRPPSRAEFRTLRPVPLTIVAIAITAARALGLFALSDQGYFAKYAAFAAQILAGHPPLGRLGDLSPGYLWTVVGLTGPLGLGVEGVRLVQCAAVCLSALAAAAVARRLGGETAAWVAALLLLSTRGAWVNASELEPETLVLVLNAGGLAVLFGGPSRRRDVLGGVLLGLSAATRPTVLPAVAALLAWRCVADPGEKQSSPRQLGRLRRGLPLALGVVTPLVVLGIVLPIVGPVGLMNPGTVFYEGWNPEATGYLGEAPRVVKDIEGTLSEPDALHVAYRLVADRASGVPDSNRFWGGLGIAALRRLPCRSVTLAARKAWLALHSYDAWDLSTMVRRDRELRGLLWAPFGLLAALAGAAIVLARHRPGVLPLAAFAIAQWAALVLFYVTSRQRNAMLPAAAALAGVGAAMLLAAWRERRRAVAGAVAFAAVALAVALTLPATAQREDAHSWTSAFAAHAAVAAAERSSSRKDTAGAIAAWCESALHLGPIDPELPQGAVRSAIAARLTRIATPAERFDLAIASIRARDWTTADRLLAALEEDGYRPSRGAEITSSIAYQRARCRLHLGDPAAAADLLATARRQAPGQADIVALAAEVAQRDGDFTLAAAERNLLEALHDPFTAERARARATADIGDHETAARLLSDLAVQLPEWRPTAPL